MYRRLRMILYMYLVNSLACGRTSLLFAPTAVDGLPRGKRVLLSSWCPCKETALLAVALEGGTVLVLNEDGSVHEEVTRNRAGREGGEAVPTCLSWTSTQVQGGNVLLAVGWQDGVVMVWSEKDRMERCDDEQHAGHPISFVYFSPEGSRLIAADCRPGVPTRPQDAAVLCVYKVDPKGRFNSICPYKKPSAGALTHAVFRTAEQKKKLVTSSFAAADIPPFYYGGETGVILLGDDLGRASEAIPTLGGAVGAMLYLPERDTLVVVTMSAMLCTFKLTDNKPTPLVKSKLSVGREGFQAAAWCGVGQLAIVSADAVVRVNDLLDDEDNFALSLSDVPGMAGVNDKLSSLAYHTSRRLLAAGTRDGRLAVWRHTGGGGRGNPEAGWEALPIASLGAEPASLAWSHAEPVLAAAAVARPGSGAGSAALQLLPETVLRCALAGEWAYAQQGAQEVLLEHPKGARLLLTTPNRIKGCDVSGEYILTWTGRRVEVYQFDDSATDPAAPPGPPVLLGAFDHKCTCAAIYSEGLFLGLQGRLECVNFSGSVLATLPFADAEGTPVAIHVAGRTVSDKRKQVWDVSRKEPKQLLGARKLGGDALNAKVAQIAISSDGTRVAACLQTQPGGMEALDVETRKALVDFSYFLTVGAMDEAHKAVKLVRSAAVWENMARMCVQTKRLDIADTCLGNMGHARGARAVRDVVEAHTRPDGTISEPEVCAAVVAVQLGMLKEAEQLYASCGRHDLLNTLYQASGQWEKALEIAEKEDRIHLKATHYTYARQLEAEGETMKAAEHFERSDTHRVEVPRMLFDSHQLPELKEFIDRTQDPELYTWWAQYAESNARFKEALTYYEKAADHLSIVRVLAFHNKLERAAEVVNASNHSGAAYHLAKQYEQKAASEQGTSAERALIQQAIQFYQRAGRYNHAIRLAKAHDLASELNVIASSSNPKLAADTAAYFEKNGQPDRAVQLYQQGGQLAKAVELCFRFSLFEQLSAISEKLPPDSDPALITRCAEFFLDHGQWDKTVTLFAAAGQCAKAIDLCIMHNVTLTEPMAEKLAPELGQKGAETEELLNSLRLKVAKVLKRQGNYHLACKMYTQAGDKVKAMKCLLRSGDTQKICYFAGVSRNRDIYILAANYLQNLDWKADPEIVKNIVQFYSKAKALDSLAAFFDSCAQIEIDDYRDYEKALGALREAHEWMGKARVQDKDAKVASLAQRISHVEAFVRARKTVKTEPEETVRLCFQLLDEPTVEHALRVGDVYALMVEWFYSQRQMEQAYNLIEKMVARSIVLAPYLDQEMIAAICASMGAAVPHDPQPAARAPTHAAGDEVEDNIEEDMDD
ncbi:intraflagellar transport protein 140-like protein [Chrysochromulina tobinii]|uniref:Intraflagellar transport protein 140-like protein n=1 Tax=Chrysochromulina tobinii TaxID=1460289 RepID=A0A0M0JK88_9EUKA|nr:intraflagellar transport protein 140-like protein [Chrysochromulina tobinii]|eukprot:KOO26905.1 intraflagellar transport protein 140-like protein [Chrysochromulina sp. CCMP291]